MNPLNEFEAGDGEHGESFDVLMREFREASVHLAQREQAACRERAAEARYAEVRLRWGGPALAALALMLVGGGWGAWWYAHPERDGHSAAHVAGRAVPTASSSTTPQVSDEALLSEVQSDLSDRVPQALQPLAVSYTSNSYAPTGQKEIQ